MRFGALAIAAAAAATIFAGSTSSAGASAAALTLSDPHVVAHFDLSAGQTTENIVPAPDGSAIISFSVADEAARVSLGGNISVLGRLPRSGPCAPNPGSLSLGLAVTDGTIFLVDCTDNADTGVWRIRPGQAPAQIASLPANGFPNDMALDPTRGELYIADSLLATVWRVPINGGAPVAWVSDTALAKTSFLGANGIAVHGDAVWVSNTDKGTIVRIPIRDDGTAGSVQTVVTGLTGAVDNFTFLPGTDIILAAETVSNQVVLINNGQPRVLLTAADGLSNPTCVAVQNDTLYVGSGAVAGGTDPNLLIAHINF